ncbi:MAG: hypothetical protein IM638_03325 [Bacteroidetes bacterium]|nr:hypothetical protein [Bacteroidota bacterium]
MKTLIKDTDRTLQLILLVLIGIVGVTVLGWMLLMFLFPLLALIQLLSAVLRTAESIGKKTNNRRFYFTYWIMVAVWAMINGFIWAQTSFRDSVLSQMGLSILIAVYYYSGIRTIDKSEEVEQERIEIAENHRLAEMMK